MKDDPKAPVVILCGGPAPHPKAIEYIPDGAFLMAVDSGLDHARDLGLEPNLVIGDLDSISPTGLRWAKEQNIAIKEFSKDKDKSDLELALDEAKGISKSIFVIGSDTGRFDHAFGVIAALGSATPFFRECHALIGSSYLTFICQNGEIYSTNGTTVSVFTLGAAASGVALQGFRWELVNAYLPSGSTLGLSNELLEEVGTISVDDGVLVVVQPNSI